VEAADRAGRQAKRVQVCCAAPVCRSTRALLSSAAGVTTSASHSSQRRHLMNTSRRNHDCPLWSNFRALSPARILCLQMVQ
jgi:hypothetical protein